MKILEISLRVHYFQKRRKSLLHYSTFSASIFGWIFLDVGSEVGGFRVSGTGAGAVLRCGREERLRGGREGGLDWCQLSKDFVRFILTVKPAGSDIC